MKKKPIRVALLFGGKSAEHEVSIQSAKNVYNALIEKNFDVTLIGIDKKGKWAHLPNNYLLEASTELHELEFVTEKRSLDSLQSLEMTTLLPMHHQSIQHVDVVFPILHGPYGEDGSMQGMLQIADLPFVGSGVLGSAVGMDKDVCKRLLRDAGLPISKFLVFRKGENVSFASVKKELGLPCFVKPANLGSSIGVTKVSKEDQFNKAIAEAFLYDKKIIIEESIIGRELECAVLGNDNPKASLPGEVVLHNEFYDYDTKYVDEEGADIQIPAKNLSEEQIKEMQHLAIKTFNVLCLSGMARIDFFLSKDNKFYINEANTIPGFTNISMYPKLWEASGLSYADLVEELITLALEKHSQQKVLQTSL